MKKKISVFICMMLAMIMATGVVFAATVTDEKDVYRGTHLKTLVGDKTNCTVGGNSSLSYMYMINKSTSSKYLTTQIKEYKYNVGWTSNTASKESSIATGSQLYLSVPRDTSMYGYYYYVGKCKDNAYTPAVYDTFNFTAYQDYH